MKRNTNVLLKTTALVLAFVLLLGVGIMSLTFSHSGVKPNDSNFLTPDLAITAPTSQELLQRKYNAYNTVTEENGKSVITIFSEEQIADFDNRRNKGEWFWLSSEEMLFLINNTVELFKTYDIVYIRDLDGNLNKYYGLSFFSSEEYYASFNGFDLGVTDASFDLKKDIYETIFNRVEVLNSAVYDKDAIPFALTDVDKTISNDEIVMLQGMENPWYYEWSKENIVFGVWYFNDETMYYCSNIQNTDYSFNFVHDGTIVFPNTLIPNTISSLKYDRQDKNVVIEVYERKSDALIARIRLDKQNNPKEILKLETLTKFIKYPSSNDKETIQYTDYQIVVYFNGLDSLGADTGIVYCPDGNLDYFRYSDGDDILHHDYYYLKDAQPLTKYINEILIEYFQK